ncbi:MAG: M16 family metallopeptidase [Actinomycetes bacterium]
MTDPVPGRPDRFLARRAVDVPPPVERVRRTVLPGGVRVVTDSMEAARSAAVSVWVTVGGRDEPAPLAGASHFLEHLLFKGTPERDARSIACDVDAVGGEMNAYTSSEHTVFYARVPAGAVEEGTDLLLDVVGGPALRPEDVESERQVILEELAAVEDDPDDVVGIRLFESLFPDHPLGREVLGTEETVEALTRDDVAGFFDHWYRPANLVVVGAGLVDHDLLVTQVEARFGGRPVGERPERSAPEARPVRRVVEERPVEQVHLALAWRTVPATHPDRFAVAVLNQLLGAGPSSRLFQEVREERALAYGISSSTTSHVDAGALTVACATSPGKATQVLDIVRREVAQLAADGPSDAEVRRAVGALRGGLLVSMEDAANRMLRLGTSESLRGGAVPVAEHLARLDVVSLDDVRRVATSVLGGDEVLAVVGPPGSGRL